MNEEVLHQHNQHQIHKLYFDFGKFIYFLLKYLVNLNRFKNNVKRNTINY